MPARPAEWQERSMDSAAEEHATADEFLVIGIGASAGGIAAIQSLLKHIPATANLTLVVIQHSVPDKPSQLATLIGKWTAMPVREPNDGMKVEPHCIYVARPDRILGLKDGMFVTRPFGLPVAGAGIDTIDSFFESLAEDFGPRAVAVVLSGTGADGAAGAVRIKQAGGMVLVQDPTTAMYDGMPNAAIANGGADHILPLSALALELLAGTSPSYVRSSSAATWADGVTKALDGIIELIQSKAGIDLTAYKTAPLL